MKCIEKKRRYWPIWVYGDAIIGGVGCLSGEWEATEFKKNVLKEPENNIMMMSTF